MGRLACLVLFFAATATKIVGQEPTFDEATLQEHKVATDDAGLLDFFRSRTPSDAKVRQFRGHLADLGGGTFRERSTAAKEIVAMGPVVRPLLQQAVGQGGLGLEAQRRAQQLLQQMPEGQDFLLLMAAAREVARRKPGGAAPALLDILPFLPTETVRQEVQSALNRLAGSPGADDALKGALAGTDVSRRAAAAEALVRAGAVEKERLTGLLRDPARQVRFQAALAAVEAFEPAGLPVLIDLLPELSPEPASLALDLLSRAAGDDAPPDLPRGGDTPDRVRAAWRVWHGAHAAKVDLPARLARKDHGLTVIASTGGGAKSWVVALGPDGKEAWRFSGPRGVTDLQVLGRNRLLLAEFAGQKVTERDFRGNVLWEKPVEQPLACQRLPDGNTFIATKTRLLIVDAAGREVFTGFGFGFAEGDGVGIVTALRLRDGRMAALTADGQCHLLDPDGRERRSFAVGSVQPVGTHLDLLPNGHLLVASLKENRVAEFDLAGRIHAKVPVVGPTSAQRLANGNTLVVCMRTAQVVEITPTGEEVWDHFPDGRPYRARRW